MPSLTNLECRNLLNIITEEICPAFVFGLFQKMALPSMNISVEQ